MARIDRQIIIGHLHLLDPNELMLKFDKYTDILCAVLLKRYLKFEVQMQNL